MLKENAGVGASFEPEWFRDGKRLPDEAPAEKTVTINVRGGTLEVLLIKKEEA